MIGKITQVYISSVADLAIATFDQELSTDTVKIYTKYDVQGEKENETTHHVFFYVPTSNTTYELTFYDTVVNKEEMVSIVKTFAITSTTKKVETENFTFSIPGEWGFLKQDENTVILNSGPIPIGGVFLLRITDTSEFDGAIKNDSLSTDQVEVYTLFNKEVTSTSVEQHAYFYVPSTNSAYDFFIYGKGISEDAFLSIIETFQIKQ
jgi:hypothetical protein